ncbi:hypothetical protein [Halobellus marinus]|uniref:hypothetical protein n=1 Tax=Halobellus TaxID=1073986 RepID=UPI0028AC12E5|nr:hypothetical protein [Halobellus sp. DFY28]
MPRLDDQFDDEDERKAELVTEFKHGEKDVEDVEDMLYEAVESLQNIQFDHKEEANFYEAWQHIEIAWWMMRDNADKYESK